MAFRSRASTRLSEKGQVVIPKAIRDANGWGPGIDLMVEAIEGGVVLRPRALTRARTAQDLLGCTGYQGPRRTLSEMEAAVAKQALAKR